MLPVFNGLCQSTEVPVQPWSLASQVSQVEASAAFDRYQRGNFFLTQPSAGSVPFLRLSSIVLLMPDSVNNNSHASATLCRASEGQGVLSALLGSGSNGGCAPARS